MQGIGKQAAQVALRDLQVRSAQYPHETVKVDSVSMLELRNITAQG